MGVNRKDQTRASSLHQGRREALQKENKTVMAAFSILAILIAYAAAGPVPTTEYNNHEPQVSTKPFRHTAPGVTCRTEYVVLWSTKYEEREEQVCQTLVQNLCRPTTRQECNTKQTEVCKEIKRNVCVQKFKTEYQPYTESKCTTEYKQVIERVEGKPQVCRTTFYNRYMSISSVPQYYLQDCQYAWKGAGNDKVWAPIEGTCQNVPYDSCKEVAKTQAKQVAYQECHDVPETKCSLVPEQVCVNVPEEVCQQVPKQQCHAEHKKFPIRISRQEAKKVCNVPGQSKSPSSGLAPSIPSIPGAEVAVVPTFTAPAPVPSSPAFNQQPLDQQRGVAFEDEDDHANVDDPTRPLQEVKNDKKPSTQLQGGLSTLDEILAARRANAKPQLSEKLVFSS